MSLIDNAIAQLDTTLAWLEAPARPRRYRWHPQEDALLRRICTRLSRPEVAAQLTALLRQITGDPNAVRSVNACYIRFQQLALSAYEGEPDEAKISDAARQTGVDRTFLDAAAAAGELPTRRAGKLRLVNTRDLANWFVAFRERQLAQGEVLNALEGEDLVAKQQAMHLTGLSETHLTRYLIYGVITAWHLPGLRPGRPGDWLVRRDSVLAFLEARAGGRLDAYLDQFPSYRQWQQRSTAEIRALRQAGRITTATPEDSRHHHRLQRAIAQAGLLTVRDLMARWGCNHPAVVARVRRNHVPCRRWGRYLVFELADIEAIERSKGWRSK